MCVRCGSPCGCIIHVYEYMCACFSFTSLSVSRITWRRHESSIRPADGKFLSSRSQYALHTRVVWKNTVTFEYKLRPKKIHKKSPFLYYLYLLFNYLATSGPFVCSILLPYIRENGAILVPVDKLLVAGPSFPRLMSLMRDIIFLSNNFRARFRTFLNLMMMMNITQFLPGLSPGEWCLIGVIRICGLEECLALCMFTAQPISTFPTSSP